MPKSGASHPARPVCGDIVLAGIGRDGAAIVNGLNELPDAARIGAGPTVLDVAQGVHAHAIARRLACCAAASPRTAVLTGRALLFAAAAVIQAAEHVNTAGPTLSEPSAAPHGAAAL